MVRKLYEVICGGFVDVSISHGEMKLDFLPTNTGLRLFVPTSKNGLVCPYCGGTESWAENC